MDKADRRIEELADELELLSQIEEQAMARLAGDDEAWNQDKDHTIKKMFDLVTSVKSDDPSSKAHHVLGQLLAEVEKLRAPGRIVQDLTNKRRLLHTLRDQRSRHAESLKVARESYEAYRASD